jgi:hypothetical protein
VVLWCCGVVCLNETLFIRGSLRIGLRFPDRRARRFSWTAPHVAEIFQAGRPTAARAVLPYSTVSKLFGSGEETLRGAGVVRCGHRPGGSRLAAYPGQRLAPGCLPIDRQRLVRDGTHVVFESDESFGVSLLYAGRLGTLLYAFCGWLRPGRLGSFCCAAYLMACSKRSCHSLGSRTSIP